MIKVGDFIIDNDPRIPYQRKLEIISIFQDFDKNNINWSEEFHKHTHPIYLYVYAKDKNGKEFRIRMDRIFPDGKKRRSGFTLVQTFHYDEEKKDD